MSISSSHSPGSPSSKIPPSASDEVPELIIRPRKGWIAIDWRELIRYRELLFFLVWRDVKVRYKQTVLGIAWAVLQPLFSMIIFSTVLGNVAGLSDKLPKDLPYAIFTYAGLLPWLFFAAAFSIGGMSLVNQQQLLTKIYLPRLFVPTASVGGAMLDMAISFGVFGLILVGYEFVPSWGIVAIPGLLVLLLLASLGSAYLLSALTVSYRDFRFLIPFLIQSLMWLSWTVVPLQGMKAHTQWVLAINPMFGIVKAFRSAFLGARLGEPWDPITLSISSTTALALFLLGLFYFRKTERRFADIA